MSTRAQATPRTRPDSPGFVFMRLLANGVVFLPASTRLAFEAGSNPLAVAVARGGTATPTRFENQARGKL